MSDDEKSQEYTLNEYDICNKCSYSTDSYDHYQLCEIDHAAIAAAKKWVRRMELEDEAIDEYIRLQDDSWNPGPIHRFIENYINSYVS